MAETTPGRPLAILKLPKKKKEFVTYAKSVVTALTGNPNLPTPNPPIDVLHADVQSLDGAETTELTRVKGARQVRDAKMAVVKGDLELVRGYVQQVADADPANATTIIQSAGMFVRSVTLHSKGPIGAKIGKVTGTAVVSVKSAAHRSAYQWQYSLDQKTWTNAAPTLQAKTTVSGLTSGTTYYFRARSLTKDGEGDWSQVVSLLVV